QQGDLSVSVDVGGEKPADVAAVARQGWAAEAFLDREVHRCLPGYLTLSTIRPCELRFAMAFIASPARSSGSTRSTCGLSLPSPTQVMSVSAARLASSGQRVVQAPMKTPTIE